VAPVYDDKRVDTIIVLPETIKRPAATSPFKRESLALGAIWAIGGNAVYSACQWALLVVLVRLGDPENVGQFALGLAVSAPIALLFSLSLRTVQATDASRNFYFRDYLGLRLLSTTIAFALIFGIAVAGNFSRTTAIVLVAVGLSKSIESIIDIFYGLFQLNERMSWVSQSLAYRGIAGLLAASISMLITRNSAISILSITLVWLSIFLLVDLPRSRSLATADLNENQFGGPENEKSAGLKPAFERQAMVALLVIALPFGLSTAVNSLIVNVPRYFVQNSLGEDRLGVFVALTYVIVAGTTVIAAISQAAMPRLSRYHAQADYPAFRSLFSRLLYIGTGIGAATIVTGWFFGAKALRLIYGSEYSGESRVFFWLCVSGAIFYVGYFLDIAVFAAQKFRIMLPLNLVSIAVAFAGCFFLVPEHGLLGAAWALLASALTLNLLEAYILIGILGRLKGGRNVSK